MRPEHETILTGTPSTYRQAITASAASTSSIKVGTNAGSGERLRFRMTVVDADFHDSGGADATLTFKLQHSTTDSGYADLVSTAAIPVASLVQGYHIDLDLPDTHSAYIQGYFTVANGPFDAGYVNLCLLRDTDTNDLP